MAAFSEQVTTFQPKTWPNYYRNSICQTKRPGKNCYFY